MTCLICRQGETKADKVTVTLEREGAAVIFRSVPAEVCENCGEQYVDADTTQRLLEQTEQAVRAGVEVEVRSYVAA